MVGAADLVLLNLASWFGQIDYVITSGMIFRIYGCFLLGFLLGRQGVHADVGARIAAIRTLPGLGLVIGLPLNFVYARTYDSGSMLHTAAATAGILPLSVGYASVLAWIWLRSTARTLTEVFGPVGRMALTNCVGQSVICMLIFRGVGLKMGGALGPTLYLPLGIFRSASPSTCSSLRSAAPGWPALNSGPSNGCGAC